MGLFNKTSKEPKDTSEDSLGVPGEEGEDLGEAPEEPMEEPGRGLPERKEREERREREGGQDIFGDRPRLKRKDIVRKFEKKASHKIPGSRKWYTREQRKNLAEELFARAAALKGKKHKEFMSREDLRRVMKKLKKERLSGAYEKRLRAEEKFRWYQRELGDYEKRFRAEEKFRQPKKAA